MVWLAGVWLRERAASNSYLSRSPRLTSTSMHRMKNEFEGVTMPPIAASKNKNKIGNALAN